MNRDTIFFLVKPSSPKGAREFEIGVVEMAGDPMTVRFDEDPELEGDALVTVFFRKQKHFMRQEFKVRDARLDPDDARRYQLSEIDEPVDGEERKSERISTVYESMLARFGDEKDCMVIDISEEGLAVIAREDYAIGEEMTFEMWIRSTLYRGIVEIRSVATAARGKFRYGLRCLPDVAHHNLSASLRDLSVDLQVKYLQRLSI